MALMDGLTGIVMGGVFGSIFVITCIISSIKAVRDREVIKRRIAVKQQEKLKNGVTGNKSDSSIEEVLPSSSHTAQQKKRSQEKTASVLAHKNGSFERLDLSVYSIDRGVDNATFKHSFSDIKHANDKPMSNSSSLTAAQVPSYQKPKTASKRTSSQDPKIRDKHIEHLPSDCLAVKKVMRSNSYELAVAEHSWLPMDMSNNSTSKTTKTFRDRKVIKRRIAIKQQEKLKNGVTGNKSDSSIEEVLPSSSHTAQQKKSSQEKTASVLAHKNGSFERLDLSAYSIDRGVDNATFKHSFSDIKHANDKPMSNSSSLTAKQVPSYQKQKTASKRTSSQDPKIRDKHIEHLPSDCLAVKKVMRSNSYELAVAEHSWLPMDMSNNSTSKTTKTFRYSDASRNNAKTTNVCFDNRAYDKYDLKRT